MLRQLHIKTVLVYFMAAAFAFFLLPAQAQEANQSAYFGSWIINPELSDNTDKEVGRVLRAMGQKIKRCWLNCEEDRFRGGPKEQELYDRISYDKMLTIELRDDNFLFTYENNYLRPVYTDNRSQSVSLTGLDSVEDFSFGHWEKRFLEVEARPRDGGFANESYSLINDGTQLKAELFIQPGGFDEPIELVRIYDKIVENPAD